MTRKLNYLLLAFLIVIVAPFAWLMLDGSTRSDASKPITIEQLRLLAASIPGMAPTAVRYEVIGRRRVISDLLAAGSGLRPVPFVLRAYLLVTPKGAPVTIDRGMGRAMAARHRVRDFDPRAQAAVEHAVLTSQVTLVLAPDVQHSGFEAPSPLLGSGLPRGQRNPAKPYAVAPGIVVIPADGVRPGERMVYVRLATGRELLFTGDVAPVHTSWEQQRPPARLVTLFLVGDDREEIGVWLRTIRKMKDAAPSLQIVTGHDTIIPRALTRGFADKPPNGHAGRR